MSQGGAIDIQGGSGGGEILTITGNTGGAKSPIANNFTFVTNLMSAKFNGSSGTQTLQFGSNILIGTNNTGGGSENVGIGVNSLATYSGGTSNSGFGAETLRLVTNATGNTAIGYQCGTNLLTGNYNTILGYVSGSTYTGSESSNLLFGSRGVTGESNVVRIGEQGTGIHQQNICYMAGITGSTPVSANTPQVVVCDNAGNLTPISSSTSGDVLTSNGSSTPSFQAPFMQVVSGTLTSTQIKSLHGTPITIVAAPGSGFMIVVYFASGSYVYGGTSAFVAANGQTVDLSYGVTSVLAASGALATNSEITGTTSQMALRGPANPSVGATSTFANLGLVLYNPSAFGEITGNAANDNLINYTIAYSIVAV